MGMVCGTYKKRLRDKGCGTRYIIVKNLAPILFGSFDEALERKITFTLVPSIASLAILFSAYR